MVEKKDVKSKKSKGKSKSAPKQMRKRDVKYAKVVAKKLDKNTKAPSKGRSKSV